LFRVRNLVSDEGDQRFRQVRVETVASTMDQLAGRIEASARSGAVPPDLRPMAVAGALLAMIERISGIQANSSLAGILPAICDAAGFFLGLVTSPEGGRPADGTGWVAFSAEEIGARPSADLTAPRGLGWAPESSNPISGGRGEKTRTRILEAVGSFLGTHGVRETKVTDIARHLGISNATFYLYFRSVHEAVLALLEERTQSTPRLIDLLNACCDASAPEENAQLFVHDFVAQWLADAALYRVRDLAADEGDVRFIQAKDNSLSALRLALARRVAHCQARGGLPADLQPLAVSAAFLEMLERLAITPNFNEEVTLATAGRAAAYFLTAILCGVPEQLSPVRSGPSPAPTGSARV
jgi:AcrR family transcriptional regulator